MASLITISPLTESNIPATSLVIANAMQTDLIHRAMFGPPPSEVPLAISFNAALLNLTYTLPTHRVLIASLKSTAEVVGMAQIEFFPDGAPSLPPPADTVDSAEGGIGGPLDALPVGTNIPLCKAMFSAFGAAHMKHMSGIKHVVLHSLHVAPTYQRKGIGTALLRELFEKHGLAEQQVWLNAQLRGRDVYKKFGWREVESVDINLVDFLGEGKGWGVHRSVFLLREPGKFERVDTCAEMGEQKSGNI